MNPDQSKGQFTPSDHELTADAVLMFGAGTDTTANTLVVGTWHILNEPRILQRLKDELRQVMPNKTDTPGWATLENLPYLVRASSLPVKGSTNLAHSEASSRKVFDSLMEHREDFPVWFPSPVRLSVVGRSPQGYVYYTDMHTVSQVFDLADIENVDNHLPQPLHLPHRRIPLSQRRLLPAGALDRRQGSRARQISA